MTVMRSVFYIPGNNETFVSKAPSNPADIITLDLEDPSPPPRRPRPERSFEPISGGWIGRLRDLRPGQQLGDAHDQ